jgi:hypothetical protein
MFTVEEYAKEESNMKRLSACFLLGLLFNPTLLRNVYLLSAG